VGGRSRSAVGAQPGLRPLWAYAHNGAVPRPHCPRWISLDVPARLFKPAGIPAHDLVEVRMTLDELEALRLADLEGLYQEDAATRMGVSRPTLGRILEQARRKTAQALVLGRALRIEGGPVAPHPPDGRCGRRRRGDPTGVCPRCGNQVDGCSQSPAVKREEEP
jgi:uncharacterized protein